MGSMQDFDEKVGDLVGGGDEDEVPEDDEEVDDEGQSDDSDS